MVAQFAAIDGQVRDIRTRQAIPFARVELLLAQTPIDWQYTDHDGRFHFTRLGASLYRISVVLDGYEPALAEVDTSVSSFPMTIELLQKKTLPQSGQLIISTREYLMPDGARKEFDRARKDAKKQDCASAVRHFENGLRRFDQDASAHNDLGNCYRNLGKLDRAEESFKRAHALSESQYVALNLAELYMVQRRPDEAEAVLLETIRKQPRSGDAYYGLAIIYFAQDLFENAKASALQADANPHKIADVHLLLAKLYQREQNVAAVLQQMELYLKEAPDGANSERARQAVKTLRKNQ
jgi:tetratricopeptide (TPR) repeat protein